MLKSMTGFGRCEIADKDRKVIVEMKSVNHRYCQDAEEAELFRVSHPQSVEEVYSER